LLLYLLYGVAVPAQTQASRENEVHGRSPSHVARQGRYDGARVTAYEKWANEDVRWIITPEERAAFFSLLTVGQKEQFIEQFWARRDPTPDTLENEFKDEHYRRIAYTNEHFGAGNTQGWESDRGRAYIVLGPSDEIESHSASTEPTESERGGAAPSFPYQIWRYRRYHSGDDLFFRFVDYCKCGDYRNTSDKRALFPRPLGEQPWLPGLTATVKAVNSPQVKFKELEEIATHKIWLRQVPFRIQTDSLKLTDYTVLVPITVQVQNHDITFTGSERVERATLQILGRVMTLSGWVANIFEDTVKVEYPAGAGVPGRPTSYRKVLPLPPGEYWLELVIKDVNGEKIGSRQHRFVVRDTQIRDRGGSVRPPV
jgi:GWxTD domain-containing protein